MYVVKIMHITHARECQKEGIQKVFNKGVILQVPRVPKQTDTGCNEK